VRDKFQRTLFDELFDSNSTGRFIITKRENTVTIEHDGQALTVDLSDWKNSTSEVSIVRPILRAVSPQIFWYQLPFPPGFPFVDSLIARMIRALGSPSTGAPLNKIPDNERNELMLSLAQTLTRSEYHCQRLEYIINTAIQRKNLIGGTVCSDQILHYAYYEAASMLIAVRSVIDQVFYIAARREGIPENKAKEWEVCKIINKASFDKNPEFNTEEARLLKGKHITWYESMNTYRNVIIHQGWKYTPALGYYEFDDLVPEAASAINNPLLLPDLDSIAGRNRPHKWTYNKQTRLDTFIKSIMKSAFAFIEEIGKAWGGTIPPDGNVPVNQRPNMTVIRPHSAVIVQPPNCYLPIFSNKHKAEEFFRQMHGQEPGNALFRVLAAEADSYHPEPGFHIGIANGYDIAKKAAALAERTLQTLKIILDPKMDLETRRIHNWSYLVEIPIITDVDDPESPMGKTILLPKSDWNNMTEIYMFRMPPTINKA